MSQRATARLRTEARRRRIRAFFLSLVGVVLIGVAVVAVWATVNVPPLGEAIDRIFKTPVPGRPSGEGVDGTPIPVDFPDWDKKEPVNILLIGLDLRPDEEDTRADTQIVVHIDPSAKSVAMLSIPRDLLVEIPGHGEGRINSTYQLGENSEEYMPGGGPGLAMATVEQNFGIPIHYFAQIDFTGFERIVDGIGGVTIDVPRPLMDNEYPFEGYGFTRIYIPAGLQHMDGKTSLQYARSRHADNDIGRNYRQQQVLLAIRQQGLSLNLIPRIGELAQQLSDAVSTDLSITQVGSLANLAKEIDSSSIETVLLEPPLVTQTVLSNGADVLLPDWDLIRPKVSQAFADPKLAKESARLSVQNGTTVGGVGRKVRDLLVRKGFYVPDLSAAPDQGDHPTTTITDYTDGQKPRTIQALAEALGIPASKVKRGDPEDAPLANTDGRPVDILVVAGDDRAD